MAPSWSFFQPVRAARAISLSQSCEADEAAPPVCLCGKICLARATGKLRLSSKDLRWNVYFLAQILQKATSLVSFKLDTDLFAFTCLALTQVSVRAVCVWYICVVWCVCMYMWCVW